MSNNVATNTKNEGRCSFSRKALSVATAAVLATTMVPMLPAESAWAAESAETLNVSAASKTISVAKPADVIANGTTQQVAVTVTNSETTTQAGNGGSVNVPVNTDKDIAVVVTPDASGIVATKTYVIPAGFSGEKTIYVDANQAGTYNVEVKHCTSSDGSGTSPNSFDVPVTTSFKVSAADAAVQDSWSKGHTAEYTQKADADGDYIFTETGSAVDFGVSKVYSVDGKSVLTAGKDYEVRYYKNVSATAKDTFDGATDTLEATAPKTAGHYWLTVWPTAEYANGAYQGVTEPIAVPFEITADAAATDYSLYQVKSDKSDTTDKVFTYTGTNFLAVNGDQSLKSLGLLVDGKSVSLKAPKSYADLSGINDGDYFVFKADSVEVKTSGSSNLSDAGKHVLEIKQKEKGDSKTTDCPTVAYIDFTVEAFDLSKAELISADIESGQQATANASYTFAIGDDTLTIAGNELDGDGDHDDTTSSVNGVVALKANSYTPAKGETVVPGELPSFNKLGSYGVTFYAPKYTNKEAVNTTGSVNGTIRVVKSVASDFKYTLKGAAKDFSDHSDAASALVIDKSDKESFDAEDISWTGKAGDVEDTAQVTIYDSEGNVVSDATATGTYKVVVSVNTGLQYLTGGSDYFYIRVVNGEGANVFFTFDGKPVSAGTETVPYTGSAYDYSVVVKAADEAKTVLKEGTDYTVEIKDTDLNKVVTEIKDFGNYSISVKPLGYDFTAQTLNVKVEKGTFEGIEVAEQSFGYDASDYDVVAGDQVRGVAWTGEAVTPAVKAYNTKTVDGEQVRVYTDLSSDMYTVAYETKDGKKVAAADLKDAGEYKATITVTKAFDDAYEGFTSSKLAYASDDFAIVKTVGFSDVKASEWYADEAYKAKQLGYMTGLSGTDMLLPTANITRADVCMVLMRMAGGNPTLGANETYPTKFADVDADAYYAKAIDWAYKAGIVSGYDGTDNFGPNDLVTREQMAKMIALFAQNVQGEDISGGTLEGYVDADQLTFGKDYMAWCVENGVFGVNTDVLDPAGNAQRAQVAAISVRLCPAEEL